MSVRVGATLFTGGVAVGDTGFGILAENVPSTGENGPGYVFNELVFPADNGIEVMGHITSEPSGPNVISFVVDGVLCDGGAFSTYGWGRFTPELGDVSGSGRLRISPSLKGIRWQTWKT